MTYLRIKCKCSKLLRVPSSLAGQKVACPSCKRAYRLSAEQFVAAGQPAKSNPVTSTAKPKSVAAQPPQLAPATSHGEGSTILDPPLFSFDEEISSLSVLGIEGIPKNTGDDDFKLADDEPPARAYATPGPPAPTGPTTKCKACGKELPPNAKLCVGCGTNVKSGRTVLTTTDEHIDTAYMASERIVGPLSWALNFAIFPIASEAFGTKKPVAVRVIAAITVLCTIVFWCFDWSGSSKMQSMKYLLLWSGDEAPSAELIRATYIVSSFGDREAFESRIRKARRSKLAEASTDDRSTSQSSADEEVEEEFYEIEDEENGLILNADDATIVATYESLTAHQKCIGEFRWYQTLTHAFLHIDLEHLAGNMLFLLIIGSRVNALVGSGVTIGAYVLFMLAGCAKELIAGGTGPPKFSLGASGAIMGLAGMYLVLFPRHRVHMVAWLRPVFILFFGLLLIPPLWPLAFTLRYKLFSLRGFWVVAFYIALDVIYTIMNVEDGVAHWAHLGGFIAGVVVACALLMGRFINAHGSDLISTVLGTRAHVLIGKPR